MRSHNSLLRLVFRVETLFFSIRSNKREITNTGAAPLFLNRLHTIILWNLQLEPIVEPSNPVIAMLLAKVPHNLQLLHFKVIVVEKDRTKNHSSA